MTCHGVALYLTDGSPAIVDACDFESLSQFQWRQTCHVTNRYADRADWFDYRCWARYYMHRVVINAPDGVIVDHRDGNGLHNCRHNLRIASARKNVRNRTHKQREFTSTYRGVYLDKKRNKWVAQIRAGSRQIDGRLAAIVIGCCYATQEDAARAYDASARAYFGDFASPNFKEVAP